MFKPILYYMSNDKSVIVKNTTGRFGFRLLTFARTSFVAAVLELMQPCNVQDFVTPAYLAEEGLVRRTRVRWKPVPDKLASVQGRLKILVWFENLTFCVTHRYGKWTKSAGIVSFS